MVQIFDLNKKESNPIKGERYFIDTNVWYWTTYVASKQMTLPNQPSDYQLQDYPSYIERIINDGGTLCHCPLTFSELSNVIENTELELHRKSINNQYFDKKDFRNVTSKRSKVLNEIEVAWDSIKSMSTCLDVHLNQEYSDNVCKILHEGSLDPFDAFYVKIMREHKVDYIITDDHDFCSIDKQIVITSNKKALRNN